MLICAQYHTTHSTPCGTAQVLSYSLIMWESVGTSKEWVESWLPEVVRKWAFKAQNTSERNIDIQGMRCGGVRERV